jgi:hypothetical protein
VEQLKLSLLDLTLILLPATHGIAPLPPAI